MSSAAEAWEPYFRKASDLSGATTMKDLKYFRARRIVRYMESHPEDFPRIVDVITLTHLCGQYLDRLKNEGKIFPVKGQAKNPYGGTLYCTPIGIKLEIAEDQR